MSINDSLKKAIDSIDIDRAVKDAKSAAGELARKHGGKVDELLAKAEYADKLAAGRHKVSEVIAKVAEQPADGAAEAGSAGDGPNTPPG